MDGRLATRGQFNAGVRFRSTPQEEYEASISTLASLAPSEAGSEPGRLWRPSASAVGNSAPVVRRRRRKANQIKNALKEIRKFQKTTKLLVPKAPFGRLIKELTRTPESQTRLTEQSVNALQESTEAYIVGMLGLANEVAANPKRVTCRSSDIQLINRIRKK